MTGAAIHVADVVFFIVLYVSNFALGLYFVFRKGKARQTTNELFLGTRSLYVIPLALSTMATMVSGLGMIGFSAYFYAYGLHIVWSELPPVLLLPLGTKIVIPVLYKLKVTSVFEYLRMRYGNVIGVTSCAVFIFMSQCHGAAITFSASMAISMVFQVPLLWTTVVIGITSTIYTALGGFRGVVWTDAMLAILIMGTPFIVLAKVAYDISSTSKGFDIDIRRYLFDTSFDITKEENVWSCFIGLIPLELYRSFFDQTVAQRYLSARTMSDAKWITCVGTILGRLMYIITAALGLALIYWFRDCDPQLSGKVTKLDQILPFYVSQTLNTLPGLSGIFLAGIAGASTSTISSVINSQATTCYVDIVSLFVHLNDHKAANITTAIGFVAGITMTFYAVAIPYLGSAARVMMVVWSGISGPFVGMFLAALVFPWANAKGYGAATLLTIGFQIWLSITKILRGINPDRMPVSTDSCPGNYSLFPSYQGIPNETFSATEPSSFDLSRVSCNWSCFFTTAITIILGLVISIATGNKKDLSTRTSLTSKHALKLWQKMKLLDVVREDLQHSPREEKGIEANLLRTTGV